VIADPVRRGESLAAFFDAVAPRLWRDVVDSGALPATPSDQDATRAEREWECFALYACVRGLIAAGGFNRETAQAIDALHANVISTWGDNAGTGEALEVRRARVSERYAEYGAIGQAGGAAGADSVRARLGAACARAIAGGRATESLAALLGDLHESIVAGATEAVRIEE